ncbi:MAG: LysM peptidoglycan-binding domain-containing M23 family metallopeptidase [Mariprofundaceae bacterium]|nr:LysM peptidoglycan-binding domain-containing M23 family metallopeptidase [Mariprofundaceae bacterium]
MILVFSLLLFAGCVKTELPVTGQVIKKNSSNASRSVSYTVHSGDTLYRIGKRFGIAYKTLARNNHIRPPYIIYTGQRIYLKGTVPRSRQLPLVRHKHTPKTTRKKHSTRKVARNVKSLNFRWPVKGVLTSRFGRRGSRMHDGIDIGAKEGTPIYAVLAGEIVLSNQRLSGYGRMVMIRHRHDLFTVYAHNQRNLVRKGDTVKKGDIIARVGHTGRATGSHLHFEVRRAATAVDPLVYLPKRH